MTVEISDDPAHPEGGHAFIRFRGATGTAGPARLGIEPLTDGYDYRGPRQVEAVAAIEADGLVLAVGGGQLDQLATGVAVLLSVPEAGLSAEVLWPEVRPLVLAPRRTPVRTFAPRRVVDGLAPAARATGPSPGVTAPPAPKPRDPEVPRPVPIAATPDPMPAARAKPEPAEAPPARPPPPRREPDPAPKPIPPPDPVEDQNPRQPETATPAPIRRDEPRDVAVVVPVSRASVHEPATQPALIRQGWRWPAVAAVAVLAFGIGAAAVGAVWLARPVATAPRPSLPSLPPLFDVLTTGDVSPLGTLAATVKPDDLFDQASSFLRGVDGHAVNPAEGIFWLKRALAGAPDDARQRRPWALMRVGLEVYGIGGIADHAAGRELLQIAAAWNNAFAMCRLGDIEEHGDDISPPDRGKAILWYERAKLAGCKEADEALARLKR